MELSVPRPLGPLAFEPGRPSPQGEIYNQLLRERIIMLGSEIDDESGNMVIAQLLYL
ncbi:hypothetical protein BH18ACT1_BH18ACT1_11170 [soil metagenome]